MIFGPSVVPGAVALTGLIVPPGLFVPTQQFIFSIQDGLVGTDVIILKPFVTMQMFRADEIRFKSAAALASAEARVLIYGSAADGTPDQLLFQSAAVDVSAAATYIAPCNFVFGASIVYWLGLHNKLSKTFKTSVGTYQIAQPTDAGLVSGNGSAISRAVVPFAGGAPVAWGFDAAETGFGPPPMFVVRVAA